MRRAFLIGLGIGSALGTMWLVTVMALVGQIYVYKHWVNIRPWMAMLLLIASVAGGVWAFMRLED